MAYRLLSEEEYKLHADTLNRTGLSERQANEVILQLTAIKNSNYANWDWLHLNQLLRAKLHPNVYNALSHLGSLDAMIEALLPAESVKQKNVPQQEELAVLESPVLEEPSIPKKSVAETVRPKVVQPKKVVVPELYREGLAKVENGETYYTFDGYSPEQIGQAIAAVIFGKPKVANNYYVLDINNNSDTLNINNNTQTSPSTFTRTSSIKSSTPPIVKRNNDEGAFLYKYPGRDVHVYKVLPEVADIVRKNLQGQPLTTESVFTRFTNVPLTNTPKGELNDSTFHDIYIPSDMDKEAYNIYHKYYLPEGVVDVPTYRGAEWQISAGQHSNDELPIVLLSASNARADKSNYIETGQGNLVFFNSPYNNGEVYAYKIIPSQKTEFSDYPEYKDNTGKQHMGTYVTNMGEIKYDLFWGKLSNYGIPVQSWKETSEQLKKQQNTESKGFFSRLFNFKNGGYLKSGSKIHIKKKNRGKFSDYCNGKVTEDCIQKGKHSSNPVIRKRATFAANARKWHHKNGGIINYSKFYK